MGWTVAIGIDTHADVHVAVALDRLGGGCGSTTISADANGYLALWRWARELGEPAFAIEGSGQLRRRAGPLPRWRRCRAV
jgi:transposase